ncbi:MAG: hypothetical protein KAQ78_00105, partial [Candidatus Latescibacteria bacterium]|nr:hypothetical protein [Candidatus Latescibacterota bacterium]
MKKNLQPCWILTILLMLSSQTIGMAYGASFYSAPDAPKRTPKLARKLTEKPNEPLSVWIFFTDKGVTNRAEYEKACRAWEERTSPRIRHRGTARRVPTFRDLPVLQN